MDNAVNASYLFVKAILPTELEVLDELIEKMLIEREILAKKVTQN